jgi:hypothetical protein
MLAPRPLTVDSPNLLLSLLNCPEGGPSTEASWPLDRSFSLLSHPPASASKIEITMIAITHGSTGFASDSMDRWILLHASVCFVVVAAARQTTTGCDTPPWRHGQQDHHGVELRWRTARDHRSPCPGGTTENSGRNTEQMVVSVTPRPDSHGHDRRLRSHPRSNDGQTIKRSDSQLGNPTSDLLKHGRDDRI